MRIKHYTYFKSRVPTLNWDKLRDDLSEDSYYVPDNKEQYIAKLQAREPSGEATAIIDFIRDRRLASVLSIGSGICWLEFQLRDSIPILAVSDVTASINRIASFEVFDEAFQFDVLNDPIPMSNIDLVLLPRVDTEFTDDQLHALFKKLRTHGVRYVALSPATDLGLRVIVAEVRVRIRWLLTREAPAFCGYFRNYRGLEKTWSDYYAPVDAAQHSLLIFLEEV